MGRVVLSLRLCAIIAIAVVGCYRPNIERCFLACAENDACPDGLVCNPNGICASSLTDNCSDVPGNDAGSDADAPMMTTVTIEVLGPTGAPQNDIRVLFSTPTGGMISEARTDVTGTVVESVPVGSTATIVRINGANYNATTYTDLWEGAHVVSKFGPTIGERAITVNWQAPTSGGVVFYFPYTTCNSPLINTTNLTVGLNISNNCPRYDLFLIGKNNSGTAVRIITAENLDASTAVQNFTQAQWKVINANDALDVNLTNAPNGMNQVEVSPYLTPSLAYSTPIVTSPLPPSGIAGMLAFPREMNATVAVASTSMTDVRTQVYVERLPPNTTVFARDLAMRKFPWLGPSAFDIPTKTVSWPIETPANTTFVSPAVVMTKLSFRRDTAAHDWHIIGRGSHVTQNATMGSFVLPEIPGDNPFEPRDGDLNFAEKVIYLGTTPGAEDALRARIQSHDAALDIFGIPGVTYVFRATAE